MNKKAVSLILIAVMLLALIPMSAFADQAKSGVCGSNAAWSFDDGRLTVFGSGRMYDYNAPSEAPWSAWGDKIDTVAVNNGITDIGKNAFSSCVNLRKVFLPVSIEEVYPAFSGTALESIYYGGTLKQWLEIKIYDDSDAFYGAMVYLGDTSDPFTDIEGWYHDYIVDCYAAGIINGYPDGTFRPDNLVTRAEFVKMLYNMCGSPDMSGFGELPFSDTDEMWNGFNDAVLWGSLTGVVRGYDDLTFRPNESISRAQMATFAYRVLCLGAEAEALGEYKTDSGFTDSSDILRCYKEAVGVMSGLGIIEGFPDNSFRPNETASRGQSSKVLVKTLAAIAMLNEQTGKLFKLR